MNEVFLPILEMAILLPTVLAIFLPVQDWLRVDKKKLFLILFPCLALYCLLGGLFCYSFKLPTNLLTIPELILGTLPMQNNTVYSGTAISRSATCFCVQI